MHTSVFILSRPRVDLTFQVIARINQRLWPISRNKQRADMTKLSKWLTSGSVPASQRDELLLTRSFRQQLSHKRGQPLRSAVIIRASRYTGYTYLVCVSFLIEPFVRKWFYVYVHRQVFSRPRDRHGKTKRGDFSFAKRNKLEEREIRWKNASWYNGLSMLIMTRTICTLALDCLLPLKHATVKIYSNMLSRKSYYYQYMYTWRD